MATEARLPALTTVTIRSTPAGRWRISTSSSAVATPRPCQPSTTVTATSAAVGSWG